MTTSVLSILVYVSYEALSYEEIKETGFKYVNSMALLFFCAAWTIVI